jgi:hypothetical protein
MNPALLEQLALLDDEQRRELFQAAQFERQRRIRLAVLKVRESVLGTFSNRSAARAIGDVVRGCGGRLDPILRVEIERQLRRELGDFEDIPGQERIRQVIRSG